MIGSRVNVLLAALALSTTALAADPEPAAAPPRGLTPGTAPVAAPSPVATGPAEQAVPDKPGAPAGPRVTVSDLAAIDPDGAGLMNPGLGQNLWAGSVRPAMAARISQLPAAPNSPAMQNLLKRVLLTQASPPSGEIAAGEPSFLAQRLQKLIASGLIAEAAQLGAQSRRTDPFARQALVEALFLQGRDDDACGDASSLRQSSNDPYWLKLRAFCQLKQNDTPGANLTLDVMRARSIEDAEFFTLADALIDGGKANVKSLPLPSGLLIAMLRQAGSPIPASLAGWVPAAASLAQSNDAVVRLGAAERATIGGAMSVDELRSLYDSEVFAQGDLDAPDAAAAKLAPARANALFYQSISTTSVPAGRATAFAAALSRAEQQNRFALFSALTVGIAQQTRPSPETAWLAPGITRVLMATRHDKAAEQWLLVLVSPTDAAAANALQVQLGLVRPSTDNLARMPAAIAWLGQNALKPGPAKNWLMDRALREIPLLDAFGHAIPPDAQWAVSANAPGAVPTGTSAEALAALSRSAADGKIGETALNALVALGPSGPARAQGQTVVRVVRALNQVGLREDARAIAIESVLASPVRK